MNNRHLRFGGEKEKPLVEVGHSYDRFTHLPSYHQERGWEEKHYHSPTIETVEAEELPRREEPHYYESEKPKKRVTFSINGWAILAIIWVVFCFWVGGEYALTIALYPLGLLVILGAIFLALVIVSFILKMLRYIFWFCAIGCIVALLLQSLI